MPLTSAFLPHFPLYNSAVYRTYSREYMLQCFHEYTQRNPVILPDSASAVENGLKAAWHPTWGTDAHRDRHRYSSNSSPRGPAIIRSRFLRKRTSPVVSPGTKGDWDRRLVSRNSGNSAVVYCTCGL